MGLLAPLYALAALAVVGPIVFHLIRREPKGKQTFSSLMFLQPSPPKLTRRSRLDNWLLLLLRMLAIALIAFAFARPYVRQESLRDLDLSGRTVVLMIDTSASMQRADVWQQALREADDIVQSLSSLDRVALYTVSDRLTAQVPLEEAQATDPATLQQSVANALRDLTPEWLGGNLSEGLSEVCDALSAARITGQATSGTAEVILISDLHEGSGIEGLQGYDWPRTVKLDVRRVLPATPGNARASLMDQADTAEDSEQLRIRIENNPDSQFDAFKLAWTDNAEATNSSTGQYATTVQVPPGQVRVVPMPPQPAGADRIVLTGDTWEADNAVFVVANEPLVEPIALISDGQSALPVEEDFGYFLEQAPLSSRYVRRDVQRVAPADLEKVLSDQSVGAVVLEPSAATARLAEPLRAFAKRGGTVVVCLASPIEEAAQTDQFLSALWQIDAVELDEQVAKDFALVGWVDYTHPVFASFADPRFNDFSKIRIWSHRRVQFDQEQNPQLRIVAKYDDDSPMLIQQQQGQGLGSIWVMTTGWQPVSSSLALSSKFVPILTEMIAGSPGKTEQQPAVSVGQAFAVESEPEQISRVDSPGVDASDNWQFANGKLTFDTPGLYRLQQASEPQQRLLAVEMPPSESRLVPLDADVFEQYGIELGAVQTDSERVAEARQMQIEELEKSQRLWQWLLAVGLGVLAVETIMAGWMSRVQPRTDAATA